jgi:hypothetical protein
MMLASDIEARIKEIETAIQNSLNNHNALLGMLTEAKFYLDAVTKAADAIIPGTPVEDSNPELGSLPVSA